MSKSFFDRYKIIKILDEEEKTKIYIVEEIDTNKKFALARIPVDATVSTFSKTVEDEFKEMSTRAIKLYRKADSPAMVDFFYEEGFNYLLLNYKNEESLKTVITYSSIGKILNNRYLIARGIARGGFGVVYLAKDLTLPGKYWALKEMTRLGPSPELFERSFKIEAEMLSKLEHPSIPTISDFFIENNKLYLVMTYIKGETLKKMLSLLKKGEHFSEEQVLKWSLSICEVLEYLHNRPKPIIFKDIKPDNIMITEDEQVKLIDFGIARVIEDTDDSRTQHPAISPGYSPPEQISGKTDPRSDVFSLGATMYHLLTGISPKKIASDFDFPSIRELNSKVSPGLNDILTKALATKLSQRYQTITDMKNALLDLCREKAGREKVETHLSRAKEYEKKDDFFNANFEYMKALELDDKNYDTLLNIAYCCEKLNFPGKAVSYYSKALNLDIPYKIRNYIKEKLNSLNSESHVAEIAYFDDEDERTISKKLESYKEADISEKNNFTAEDEKSVPKNTLTEKKSSSGKSHSYHIKGIIKIISAISILFLFILILLFKDIFKTFHQREEGEVLSVTPIRQASPFPSVTEIIQKTQGPYGDILLQEKISSARDSYNSADYDKTIIILKEILNEDRDNLEALLLLGDSYRKLENLEKAEEQYKEVLKRSPENQEAHLGLGHIYRKKGDISKAIEEYKKAPGEAAAHNNLGSLYGNQGNMDEAIKEFKKAEEIDPEDYRTCINLGSAYYHQKNFDKSIEYYSKAIKKEPEEGEAYYYLGLAYKKKELYDKAIESFEHFIEIAPDSPQVQDAVMQLEEINKF